MSALDVAVQLAERGARDPVAAVQNQAKLAQLLKRAKNERGPAAGDVAAAEAVEARLATLLERALGGARSGAPMPELRADKIVRLPGVRPVPAGQELGPFKVDWPGGLGACGGLFAGTLDGDDRSLSSLSVRIAINGDEDLFTDGTNPEFVPLVALHPRDHRWFRLERAVSSQERWMVTFRHEGPAGAPALSPFLLFAYQRR
jgi:hypothetical protein